MPSLCTLILSVANPAKVPVTPSSFMRTPGINAKKLNTLLPTIGRSSSRCWESTSPTEELEVARSVSAATETSIDCPWLATQHEVQADLLRIAERHVRIRGLLKTRQ